MGTSATSQIIGVLILAGILNTVAFKACADTFKLRDGKTLQGTVEKRSGGTLNIGTSVGVLSVPESQIVSVTRDNAASQSGIDLSEMETLASSGRMDELSRRLEAFKQTSQL